MKSLQKYFDNSMCIQVIVGELPRGKVTMAYKLVEAILS